MCVTFEIVLCVYSTARKINVTKFVNKETGLLIVTDVAVRLTHMMTPWLLWLH